DFAAARREVEEFRRKISGLAGVEAAALKSDEALGRVARAEASLTAAGDEDKLRAAADAEYGVLDELVRNLEKAKQIDRAISVLRNSLPSAQKNRFLAERIQARIRALEPLAGPPAPAPKTETADLWKKANDEFFYSKWDDAIVTLTEVLRKDPRDAKAYAMRGHAFVWKGNWLNAEADARKALELDDFSWRAQLVMGWVWITKEDPAKASDAFTRAISGEPSHYEPYLGRARAAVDLEAFEDSLRDLDEVARLRPGSDKDTVYAQMKAVALAGKGDTEAALKVCHDWVARDPKNIEGYLTRASLYLAIDKRKEAGEDYARALKIDPNNKEALEGKEQASSTAGKPTPGTAPTSSPRISKTPSKGYKGNEAAGQKAELKKQLLNHFSASEEQVDVLSNGDIRVRMVYTFSHPDQFRDFSLHNATNGAGFVELRSAAQDDYGVALWMPRLRGTFFFSCTFTIEEVDPRLVSGIILRTTDVGDAERVGNGLGVTFANTTAYDLGEWQMYLNATGQVPQPPPQSLEPAQVRHYAKEKTSIALTQQGSKVTGAWGQKVVEAQAKGPEPFFARFLCMTSRVRLYRFEVVGYLDKEWADSVVSVRVAGAPKEFYNGKDLNGWEIAAPSHSVDRGEIAVDASNGKAASLVNKFVSFDGSAKIEMRFKVERAEPEFTVGIVAAAGGDMATDPGNYLLEWQLRDGASKLVVGEIQGDKML
ncbi:MAG TPA: tetratricopeptide repeat protein, partial [Planctomycetota bacterium]|nr:tetratricopeptide repeat protein [Planctomycetota bacterium]